MIASETETSDRVCTALTRCDITNSEFVSRQSTPTTDRSCSTFQCNSSKIGGQYTFGDQSFIRGSYDQKDQNNEFTDAEALADCASYAKSRGNDRFFVQRHGSVEGGPTGSHRICSAIDNDDAPLIIVGGPSGAVCTGALS
jgi:hypothetical protein